MTVGRDLLTESGSIFVQISDENVHRVRALMDEIFGEENYVSEIIFSKTTGLAASGRVSSAFDYLLWYAKSRSRIKYRSLKADKSEESKSRFSSVLEIDGSTTPASQHTDKNETFKLITDTDLTKPGPGAKYDFEFCGKIFTSKQRWWGTQEKSLRRISKTNRLLTTSTGTLRFARNLEDTPGQDYTNAWLDIGGAVQSRSDPKVYVVQTGTTAIARCLQMTTDPGDLVLDPTCGSGTTATVAEQWGRRWITIDTSRVALALARTRIMSSRYPFYYLADSPDGREAEMKLTEKVLPHVKTYGDIRQGFVYDRAPYITLKSIANNAEIDIIWESAEEALAPLRDAITGQLPTGWLMAYREKQNYDVEVGPEIEEWEIPRDCPEDWPADLHKQFWDLRIARQTKIDESIARAADVEMLYDRPIEDKSKVRVAGPFTVESLSPHRIVPMDDQEDEILEGLNPTQRARRESPLVDDVDYVNVILENLRSHGAQQGNKDERIDFVDVVNWNGVNLHAEGVFIEVNEKGEEVQRRVGIQIGPEYGSLRRADIAAAAREAHEAGYDMLLSCAFAFDAHASDLNKLGPLRILKAKMNPDLHMAEDLKNTGKGNLFLIIGEPDIADPVVLPDGRLQIELRGMDVFVPKTGEIRSNELKDIAAWFIDTDYNEESFFVRHAYFLSLIHI